MQKKFKFIIGVDPYGLDKGFKVAVDGVIQFAEKNKDIKILIAGKTSEIQALLPTKLSNIFILEADNGLQPTDSALTFRDKTNSSLIKLIDLAAGNKIDAIISGNNSKCYFAAASIYLREKQLKSKGLLFFIAEWPASLSNNKIIIGDIGANLSLTPFQYYEMALAIKKYYLEFYNIHNPKIALLNIGSEHNKGNEELKAAYKLLSEVPNLNFYGNLEPRYICDGDVHIVLTNGLLGNMLIKGFEGFTHFFYNYLKINLFNKDNISLFKSIDSMQTIVKSLQEKLNYKKHGSIILGAKIPCINLHGSSTDQSFIFGLNQALKLLNNKNIIFINNNNIESKGNKKKYDKLITESAPQLDKNVKKINFSDDKLNKLINKHFIKILPLLNKLRITPKNPNYYVMALTHKSWSHENNIDINFNYERLEFSGDRAINYFVSLYLDSKYPAASEGKVSVINSRIISNQNLASIAKKLNLMKYCNFANNIKIKFISPKILASIMEALFGAIQHDYNQSIEGQNLINNLCKSLVIRNAIKNNLILMNHDYKSKLQFYLSKQNPKLKIAYKTIKKENVNKNIYFTEGLFINNELQGSHAGIKKNKIHQHIAKKYFNLVNNNKKELLRLSKLPLIDLE